jgi:anti-anti-sigma regulatory factor
MSSKKPLMSHDPLDDITDETLGDVAAVPEEVTEAKEADAAGDGVNDRLVLPENLTIGEVGDYHEVLLRHLDRESAIRIDGQALQVIDGAGVQLLLAFVKDAVARSMAVNWIGASPRLLGSAKQLGVSKAMQLDQLEDKH